MTNKFPLKVVRISNINSGITDFQNINEATDLFEKFSHSHVVNRIHCEYDDLKPSERKEIIKIIEP